jgi:murein DD-endopeptidase MepM/ murein hydrolase activator NlpD
LKKKLGLYVEVDHGDISSIYAHLSEAQVEEGQELRAGEVIGITGSSGRTTGEHLHFAIKEGRQLVDPKPLLDFISKSR